MVIGVQVMQDVQVDIVCIIYVGLLILIVEIIIVMLEKIVIVVEQIVKVVMAVLVHGVMIVNQVIVYITYVGLILITAVMDFVIGMKSVKQIVVAMVEQLI